MKRSGEILAFFCVEIEALGFESAQNFCNYVKQIP